ncbi:MAG TPA: penicillin-binding protein 2 [Devosia sp.]|jgi:cell division protein FtsI (penicillin-binding protein 3)|nr:penicillin-binding protein 2 [Devosia sp.]
MVALDAGIDPIAFDGARKVRRHLTKARIRWVVAVLILIFGAVAARLVQLGLVVQDNTIEGQTRDLITATRPAILDRNGLELAVDVRVPSLFAEPRRIIDVNEAADAIHSVLPDLNIDWLRQRLTGDKGFVWIKRELTPAIEDKIMQLGIPGLDFVTESKRFYPGGPEASHILGAVNIDNQGIAGIEKAIDDDDVALLQQVGLARGNELAPVTLSIDLRVQHVMRDVLVDALSRYQADDASGIMMDIKTGEVLGLVSLPDFDPNDPVTALQKDSFNRITAGIYELGSTMKSVTIAGALDSGKVKITDSFDARFGVRFGRFTITDFHGKHRILTVPEIYKYSSNVGAIHVMQAWGKENFRAFLHKMQFDVPEPLELPERRNPVVPKTFSDIVAATASFGHGLSVSPVAMLRAMAAFANDGKMVRPTLYKTTLADAQKSYEQVVSEKTSEEMRYIMRLNALEGSGTRMNKFAQGYRAGGKTGTAEKVINGRYDSSKVLSLFASVFPLDQPRYAMMILVDNPHTEPGQGGHTAGWNAGEATGRIVARVAPMLGITPNFDPMLDSNLVPPELR